MGKIIVSENVTLDGVIQDPAGAEGFSRGGWVGRVGDQGREEAAKVLLEQTLGAEAQLFGRRTYEFLAARWPSRSGELADRLNGMPKYVVSSTLEDPAWNNTIVLRGDVVIEVSKLKQELNGEIVIPGSIQLVRTLIEHDLIDELRLMVYPIVLGAGERLFGETSDKKPMHLIDARTVDGDLAYLTYVPVQEAQQVLYDNRLSFKTAKVEKLVTTGEGKIGLKEKWSLIRPLGSNGTEKHVKLRNAFWS